MYRINLKQLSLLFILIIGIFYFNTNGLSQEPKTDENKKILVIVNGIEKSWTHSEMQDSVKWDLLESVNNITGPVALEKYGKKGINGAVIITYKKK